MAKKGEVEIKEDEELIAYCGLYCAACSSFLKGHCLGCRKNSKTTWCRVRICCKENEYESCAYCNAVELKKCKNYTNLISKTINLILKIDRTASIQFIRDEGKEAYAKEMTIQKNYHLKQKKLS